jgi:hypothetical protein
MGITVHHGPSRWADIDTAILKVIECHVALEGTMPGERAGDNLSVSTLPEHPQAEHDECAAKDTGERLVAEGTHQVTA